MMFNFDATIHRDCQCVSSLLLECCGSDLNRERNTSMLKAYRTVSLHTVDTHPSHHEAESCQMKSLQCVSSNFRGMKISRMAVWRTNLHFYFREWLPGNLQ